MSGWWSRSPSATAEVLWSACHWQDLDPCFLVSGSLCALSQGCAYKTGREFIAGWVRICLPHLCGGLGSSEAENNRLCLLLARRELATHARRAFSPKCNVATLKLIAATWGRHTPAPGVPKLVLNWVINKRLPASTAMQGFLLGGEIACFVCQPNGVHSHLAKLWGKCS